MLKFIGKELFNMNAPQTCPRCDKRGMKSWSELTDEEREVVKRLPLSANYSLEERRATHRWLSVASLSVRRSPMQNGER